MFDGPDFPKSLNEDVFNGWLEKGRASKIGYEYLLVIWDEYESDYRPLYTANRDDIGEYKTERTAASREWLVAAYNLYSESRVI